MTTATTEPVEIRVDFPGAAWSRDRDHWERHAPAAWGKLAAAWKGTGPPVHLITSSRGQGTTLEVRIGRRQARGRIGSRWADPTFTPDLTARTFAALMARIDTAEQAWIDADFRPDPAGEARGSLAGHRDTED